MTVRNIARTAATPQEVAALIQPHTVNMILGEPEYREYIEGLGELVEEITGVQDRGFTLEVSTKLGASVSDWCKHRLSRM